MDYAALVETYGRLEATEATLELTAIVADALRATDADQLPRVVTLLRGDPFAAWQPDELGLSSNLTREAIAGATGVDEDAFDHFYSLMIIASVPETDRGETIAVGDEVELVA